MTHLTMEQLVALRDAGSEPGSAASQAHVATCPQCAAELDRLHQRVARLRDPIERDLRTLVFDDPNDARLEGTAAKRAGAECGVMVPLTLERMGADQA